jgi:hypothetical protein
MGRGDRKGAFQLSACVFSVILFLWLLQGHFVPDLSSEYEMFWRAFGEALAWAAFVWLSYMALEPYVRRRWPDLLVSWARLSSGKLRDRLLGRDALVGTTIAATVAWIGYLENALPYWINISDVTPGGLIPNSLSDLRRFFGVLIGTVWGGVGFGVGVLALLFFARVILRRNWLATLITGLVLTAVFLNEPNIFFDFPVTAIQMTLWLFLLIRFGFLAFAIGWMEFGLLTSIPITLRASDWYAGRSLFVLLLFLGFALYGFRTALAGRPVFGNLAVDD